MPWINDIYIKKPLKFGYDIRYLEEESRMVVISFEGKEIATVNDPEDILDAINLHILETALKKIDSPIAREAIKEVFGE